MTVLKVVVERRFGNECCGIIYLQHDEDTGIVPWAVTENGKEVIVRFNPTARTYEMVKEHHSMLADRAIKAAQSV